MNGASKLLKPSFRPISLKNKILAVDSSLKIIHSSVLAETATVLCKAYDLQPDLKKAAAEPFIKAALKNKKAHDALIIVGRSDITWSELYLVFELIESEMNSKMYDLEWIELKDKILFEKTACSYSVLGINARHGKDNKEPPENPMQYSSAVKLIRNLTKSWLLYLGNKE